MTDESITASLRERALAAWSEHYRQQIHRDVQESLAFAKRAADCAELLFGVHVDDQQVEVADHHVFGLPQRAIVQVDDVQLEYWEQPAGELWLPSPCREDGCKIPAPFGPIRDLTNLGRLLTSQARDPRPRACRLHKPREDDSAEARLVEVIRELVDERLAERHGEDDYSE